jgi:ABC-type Zn uptake system ZnuABC Zn-binding protein ZnuA/ABC-type Mn2+/Zn2+ transport system permease subunit
MTADLLGLMWLPFLMCLVLTGIHAYLGFHVIAREVVFVDIALAQIAALGATAAFLAGYALDTWASYGVALAFALGGALVLALTRSPTRRVSQEAVIGVVYAVSAAGAVLLADRSPHGAEHLRGMLVGSLLSVGGADVAKVAGLYAGVGLLHWLCRRPFFLISTDPVGAYRQGVPVRAWDFLFYASFGLVVTSSVRIAGVLLVFSYLIVPALAGVLLARRIGRRLLVGWAFGAAVSVLGLGASATLDLPTGATVVCAFGVALLGIALVRRPGVARGATALLLLVLLAGAGCERAAAPDVAPARRQVVTSFFPLHDFARQVAGDRADVGSLVPPGVEPHDWEPSPADVARLQAAAVFVYNGAGFEQAADRLLRELAGRRTVVVDATAGVPLMPRAAAPADPHVWLDPVLAQRQVEAIRAGLERADPEGRAAYAERAAKLTARLQTLHEAFEGGLRSCDRRTIVVAHGAFGYLARRYGLTQVAAMPLAPDAEPSPAALAAVVRVARREKVTHVFFETLASPRLAETVAAEVGAKTLVLNPVEGLTREQAAAGKDYVALMQDNLANLRTALACR